MQDALHNPKGNKKGDKKGKEKEEKAVDFVQAIQGAFASRVRSRDKGICLPGDRSPRKVRMWKGRSSGDCDVGKKNSTFINGRGGKRDRKKVEVSNCCSKKGQISAWGVGSNNRHHFWD